MSLWKKKEAKKVYDKENLIPAIRCSICTGEQTAGFKDIHTGRFQDICLVRSEKDLDQFRKEYGITGEIQKFY